MAWHEITGAIFRKPAMPAPTRGAAAALLVDTMEVLVGVMAEVADVIAGEGIPRSARGVAEIIASNGPSFLDENFRSSSSSFLLLVYMRMPSGKLYMLAQAGVARNP